MKSRKREVMNEMRKKTQEYQIFVLKDIFSGYYLKELTNGIKNIVQKNRKCKEVGEECAWENSWFYTNRKNLHYFLKEDNGTKKAIKGSNTVKTQICLNLDNSERIKLKCKISENRLLDTMMKTLYCCRFRKKILR